MEMVTLTNEELMMVDGGSWKQFGLALLGTVCVAGAVVSLAAGQPELSYVLATGAVEAFDNI